jgi:hypothetical protein
LRSADGVFSEGVAKLAIVVFGVFIELSLKTFSSANEWLVSLGGGNLLAGGIAAP